MTDDSNSPIIIKRVKKASQGHHGGAWKVAYADFVTAMMAFFLLLWLLSSADEAKLEGLAEYFTPTIGIRDSMGIGFEGGKTDDLEGTKVEELSDPGLVPGQVPQGPTPESPKDTLMEGEQDAQLFEKAEQFAKQAFESDPNLRDLTDNIIVEQSPEGLKIEMVDTDKHPMFDPGSARLSQFGRRILGKMRTVIADMPNFISITGHTDATPFGRNGDYTNWELSSDRANAARRYLIRAGMEPERPKKVLGKAATELLLPEKPKSSRNRRITIILLRGSYMDLLPSHLPATRDLLSVPKPKARMSDQLKKQREELKKQEIKEKKNKVIEAPNSTILPGQQPMPAEKVQKPPLAIAPDPVVIAPEPPKERSAEDYKEFLDE